MYTTKERNRIIHQVHQLQTPKKFVTDVFELYLNKYTLVPHPVTFSFVDYVKNDLVRYPTVKTVLDVGTGSGIIARELSQTGKWHLYASDISKLALEVAKKNIPHVPLIHNRDNIWLSELNEIPDQVDCIVSNPPFVGSTEYYSSDFRENFPEIAYEPVTAIKTADDTGIFPYRQMIIHGVKRGVHLFYFQTNTTHFQNVVAAIRDVSPAALCTIPDIHSFLKIEIP